MAEYHESQRRLLQRQVGQPAHIRLLGELAASTPALAAYRDWLEVGSYLNARTTLAADAEVLLLPVLWASRLESGRAAQDVLIYLLWAIPCRLDVHCRSWDDDDESRWCNVQWAFFEALRKINVEKQAGQLAARVYGDARSRLYKLCWREWRHRRHHLPSDLEDLPEPADLSSETVTSRAERDSEIRLLKRLVSEGYISEPEFFVLLGTWIYDQSIAEYAAATGGDYQTIRKRRHRALSKVHRHSH
jgi:DNA-directed RNA polymerase specialized sigma24 family protein